MGYFTDTLGPQAVVLTRTGRFALAEQVDEATHQSWRGPEPCPCRDCDLERLNVISLERRRRIRQPWESWRAA